MAGLIMGGRSKGATLRPAYIHRRCMSSQFRALQHLHTAETSGTSVGERFYRHRHSTSGYSSWATSRALARKHQVRRCRSTGPRLGLHRDSTCAASKVHNSSSSIALLKLYRHNNGRIFVGVASPGAAYRWWQHAPAARADYMASALVLLVKDVHLLTPLITAVTTIQDAGAVFQRLVATEEVRFSTNSFLSQRYTYWHAHVVRLAFQLSLRHLKPLPQVVYTDQDLNLLVKIKLQKVAS